LSKSIGYLYAYKYINSSNQNKIIQDFIKSFDEIIKVHKKDAENSIINLSSSEGLNESIKNAKMEIQQKSTVETKIAGFKNDACDFFAKFGKQIAKNIAAFETIIDEPICFEISGEEGTKYGMMLSISDHIIFNNVNGEISEILSKSLNKAKKDPSR
jgi:hypothetical protein